jgi:hypothetical protein
MSTAGNLAAEHKGEPYLQMQNKFSDDFSKL